MKKSKVETAKTRRRIVKAAADEIRRNGIQATGLAEVMAAAGLTHGGFYRHFDSKDQLVSEACAAAINSVIERTWTALSKQAKRRNGLETIAETYLTADHRDDETGGCPFAALGSELVRSDETTREAATEGLLKLADVIAGQFTGMRPDAARRRALVALSTMIGALTLARMVTDPELSTAILRDSAKHLAAAS